MRAMSACLAAAASVAGLVAGTAEAAGEPDQPAVVATSEVDGTQHRYEDPAGCISLPPQTRELTNLTDKQVKVYSDPFCLNVVTELLPGDSFSPSASKIASFSA